MKLVVLASGRGTNFSAIADAVKQGKIPKSEVLALITYNPAAGAIEEARKRKIPYHVIPTVLGGGKLAREEYERFLSVALRNLKPDFICLAGYMRLIGKELIAEWKGKILNIHPSLLPSFPGLNAQKQSFDYGVKIGGCTVHFVTEGLDDGPILFQKSLALLEDDTAESYAARLLPIENQLYVEALVQLASRPFRLEGRTVLWKN